MKTTKIFYSVSLVLYAASFWSEAQSFPPLSLLYTNNNGRLQVSWPQYYIGCTLEIQTNNNSIGLGTNWTAVPGSNKTNVFTLPAIPANGTVFLRLRYP